MAGGFVCGVFFGNVLKQANRVCLSVAVHTQNAFDNHRVMIFGKGFTGKLQNIDCNLCLSELIEAVNEVVQQNWLVLAVFQHIAEKNRCPTEFAVFAQCNG